MHNIHIFIFFSILTPTVSIWAVNDIWHYLQSWLLQGESHYGNIRNQGDSGPDKDNHVGEEVSVLWGIPDTQANIGRLFHYPIPTHAFSGQYQHIKVASAGDDHLPSWLLFNHTCQVFQGVPAAQDQGSVLITVKVTATDLYNCSKQTHASTDFLIQVYPLEASSSLNSGNAGVIPLRHVDSNVGRRQPTCRWDDNVYVGTLVLDTNMEDLSATHRVSLIFKMANFMQHNIYSLNLEVQKNIFNGPDSRVLMAGPGNVDKLSTNTGAALSWVIACGEFHGTSDVGRVLEHNILTGRLTDELSYLVIGWRVTELLPPEPVRKAREKRQVLINPTLTQTLLPSRSTRVSTNIEVTTILESSTSVEETIKPTTSLPSSTESLTSTSTPILPSPSDTYSVTTSPVVTSTFDITSTIDVSQTSISTVAPSSSIVPTSVMTTIEPSVDNTTPATTSTDATSTSTEATTSTTEDTTPTTKVMTSTTEATTPTTEATTSTTEATTRTLEATTPSTEATTPTTEATTPTTEATTPTTEITTPTTEVTKPTTEAPIPTTEGTTPTTEAPTPTTETTTTTTEATTTTTDAPTPTTEATTNTTEVTTPTSEATTSKPVATTPTTEPTTPTTESTTPTTESTTSTTEAPTPTTESTTSTTEATTSITEAPTPTTESTTSTTEAQTPTTEATTSTTESTTSTIEATSLTTEATTSTTEAPTPTTESTTSSTEATTPITEATAPTTEVSSITTEAITGETTILIVTSSNPMTTDPPLTSSDVTTIPPGPGTSMVFSNSTLSIVLTTSSPADITTASPATIPDSTTKGRFTSAFTTSIAQTTPSTITTTTTTFRPSPRPVLLNPLEDITTTIGTFFSYTIPPDTFYDPLHGYTNNLTLSMTTLNGQTFSQSSWVQFDPSRGEIYGLPLVIDVTTRPAQFMVIATNAANLQMTDLVEISISMDIMEQASHMFVSHIAIHYSTVLLSRLYLIELVQRLGRVYGDAQPSFISVLSIQSGSVLLSWTNNTVPTSYCDNYTIIELYRQLVLSNGELNSDFKETMSSDFPVISASLTYLGVCTDERRNVTASPPTDNPVSVQLILLPIVAILLVIFVIILLYCFCYRSNRCCYCHDRTRGRYLLDDEESVSYSNLRKRQLAEDTMELSDTASSTPTAKQYPPPSDNNVDPYVFTNPMVAPSEPGDYEEYLPSEPGSDDRLSGLGESPEADGPPRYDVFPVVEGVAPYDRPPPAYHLPPVYDAFSKGFDM